eukprot:s46_g43.t1
MHCRPGLPWGGSFDSSPELPGLHSAHPSPPRTLQESRSDRQDLSRCGAATAARQALKSQHPQPPSRYQAGP